jgi:hypothetical protein
MCLGVSGPYGAPQYFPPLKSNHAAVCKKSRDEINVDHSCLVKGLCPNVRLDVYFPGFPTLKHIPHTVSFQVIYRIMFVCIVYIVRNTKSQYNEIVQVMKLYSL